MTHYLFQASYTQAGLQGVLKEGAKSRLDVVDKLAASLGGRIEAMYWSFGASDVVVLAELPDNAAAAAFSTVVAAAGVAGISTTVLLSAEDVDKARAMSPNYRAPGA